MVGDAFFNEVLGTFEGKTLLVITHNVCDLSWADHVIMIDGGLAQVKPGPQHPLRAVAS